MATTCIQLKRYNHPPTTAANSKMMRPAVIPNPRATPSWFGVEVSLPLEVVVVVVAEDSVPVGLEDVVAPVVLKLVEEADVSPLFESSGGNIQCLR